MNLKRGVGAIIAGAGLLSLIANTKAEDLQLASIVNISGSDKELKLNVPLELPLSQKRIFNAELYLPTGQNGGFSNPLASGSVSYNIDWRTSIGARIESQFTTMDREEKIYSSFNRAVSFFGINNVGFTHSHNLEKEDNVYSFTFNRQENVGKLQIGVSSALSSNFESNFKRYQQEDLSVSLSYPVGKWNMNAFFDVGKSGEQRYSFANVGMTTTF